MIHLLNEILFQVLLSTAFAGTPAPSELDEADLTPREHKRRAVLAQGKPTLPKVDYNVIHSVTAKVTCVNGYSHYKLQAFDAKGKQLYFRGKPTNIKCWES